MPNALYRLTCALNTAIVDMSLVGMGRDARNAVATIREPGERVPSFHPQ